MPPSKYNMYLFIASFGIERLRMSSFVHTLVASGALSTDLRCTRNGDGGCERT